MRVINNIKYLSQRDPRWSNIKLGGGNLTVGRYGCTTTCLSMLSDFFGCYQDPGQIATNLKNYVPNDSNISWTGLDFPTFSFRWREGNMLSKNPNDVNIEVIKAYLANVNEKYADDRAVILEVSDGSHWVVGLWETYDKDILAIDPWTGRTCEVFKDYKNITGASLFVKWDKTKNGGKKAFQVNGLSPKSPDYL